ncbi:hypothetical protein J3Q64DRAFT_1776530 [Phycomyces blakesleeanus]|uniref:Uncharacterized protein n=1 Tax=Phycomyces blakesleeanus TaxID=4837 RepID=A0ABR3AI42_PHYBL
MYIFCISFPIIIFYSIIYITYIIYILPPSLNPNLNPPSSISHAIFPPTYFIIYYLLFAICYLLYPTSFVSYFLLYSFFSCPYQKRYNLPSIYIYNNQVTKQPKKKIFNFF